MAKHQEYTAGLLVSVMFMGSTLVTPLYPLYRRAFGFSEIVLTYRNVLFASTIAAFGAVAFVTGWRYVPREE